MARRTQTREFVATDSNGRRVYVGNFIDFLFWFYSPRGEEEVWRQGRIIKKGGHLCFRFKWNGRFVTHRLSALRYVPENDWERTNQYAYKDNIE